MFDLRSKELKYAKELLLNHYRKPVQNSVKLQDMCVGRIKTVVSRITYVRCFEVICWKQGSRTQYCSQIRIN